ncbi:PrsW family intramembrane metalloprotease [Thermococcus zilligii]|uniref:PrsW family intramembrane metalloprotease n=1 Tax=Thermococcus zilligii TaxID=54076 RepID=UPI000299EFB2|nr:PrsW family glutamic-type intramembrane protease [Thermococcus zilligii]
MGALEWLVFFAYVPVLILLWYFYHEDKLEPEPKKYVIGTFLLGATLSVGVAFVVEALLTPRWGIGGYLLPAGAFYLALVAGVVEEPSKALAILFPFRAGQMDGIMDGVVYGVAAGLGFAATENFLYGLGYGLQVTVFRALLTPFAHGTWSAIVGVGYGLVAEGKGDSVGGFLLTAMVLHFLWDYFAFLSIAVPAYDIILILLLFVNVALLRYLLIMGRAEDEQKAWYYLLRRMWG